jgi:hypothetical protein
MTRVEQAAERVRKEQARREAKERRIAEERFQDGLDMRTSKAILVEETRNADKKQRYAWGAIAQDAGLFPWTHAEFQAVCVALGRLKETPNPAAILRAAIGDDAAQTSFGAPRPPEKVDNKKRYSFGALAQEAGLFVWTTAAFQAVCGVLAQLRATPHPGDELARLLDAYCDVFGTLNGTKAFAAVTSAGMGDTPEHEHGGDR